MFTRVYLQEHQLQFVMQDVALCRYRVEICSGVVTTNASEVPSIQKKLF